jgi:hypothetical protein
MKKSAAIFVLLSISSTVFAAGTCKPFLLNTTIDVEALAQVTGDSVGGVVVERSCVPGDETVIANLKIQSVVKTENQIYNMSFGISSETPSENADEQKLQNKILSFSLGFDPNSSEFFAKNILPQIRQAMIEREAGNLAKMKSIMDAAKIEWGNFLKK